MTDTTKLTQRRHEAEAELHRIAGELSRAQQDAELLARLKTAPDRVKRLEPQFAAAEQAVADAKVAEQDAINEARFVGLSDISVREKPGEARDPDPMVTNATYFITYTRAEYDMNLRASVPVQHTVTGFEGLPDNVFAYLVTKHPDKIPSKIMALAPGDAEGAFNRYFVALRRGHLVQ